MIATCLLVYSCVVILFFIYLYIYIHVRVTHLIYIYNLDTFIIWYVISDFVTYMYPRTQHLETDESYTSLTNSKPKATNLVGPI